MWHDPLVQEGFYGDFADEGVVRKDLHDSIDTDKFMEQMGSWPAF